MQIHGNEFQASGVTNRECLVDGAKHFTLDLLPNKTIKPGDMFLAVDDNKKVYFLVCDNVTDDNICHDKMEFHTDNCVAVRLKAMSKCGKYTTKIIRNITSPLFGLLIQWKCEHCGERFLTR